MAGSSTTRSAPNSRGQSSMRRTIHGCGSSTGSGVRSMRNGWALSNCAAPTYGLVSTAKRSGGSRRHHSHSSDWMPPIFGGKSFVTSRCFTGARAARPDRDRAARSPTGRARRAPRRRRGGSGPAWPRPARRARPAVLPRTTRALRRSQRGSRPAMYHRPWRSSSVASSASSRSSTSTHASAPAGSGRRWRRPRWTVGGHTSWQSSQPYRRSPTAGRSSTGIAPGRCSTQARQRLASITPGATMAPGRAGVEAPPARAAPVGDAARRLPGTRPW